MQTVTEKFIGRLVVKIDNGTFRVLVAGTDQESHLVDFRYNESDGFTLDLVDVDASGRPYHHVSASLNLDRQQLGELGALLLYLSGEDADLDSIPELLDGYGVSPEDMRKFARRCVDLTGALFSHAIS